MGDGHFFSVQPLSAVAEAPRPFGFLVSGGGVGQGLFLLRHRAAVADDEGVLLAAFAHHAPVFELDADGFAEVLYIELIKKKAIIISIS